MKSDSSNEGFLLERAVFVHALLSLVAAAAQKYKVLGSSILTQRSLAVAGATSIT